MPQTREHFQICRLLRVPAGVIVLTKSDVADADMRELARMEARELVAGSFLDGAPIVEVSAKTGDGLDKLRDVLASLADRVPGRHRGGPARLPIDRVFSIKGFGTVVTGTLVSGTLDIDRELQVLPRDLKVKVRGLQVHGAAERSATAGRRVAVNLGGVDVSDLARGDTLATPGSLEPTRRFDATIDVLEDARALKHGARVRFHQGTTELIGRVAVAGGQGTAGVSEVPPGESAFVRLRLEAPAVLTRGDRFILRAYSPSITIAGGLVLDPHPPRSAIRTAAGRARYERLNHADPDDEAVVVFVEERQGAGLPVTALVSRAGLSPESATETEVRLARAGRITRIGELLVAPQVLHGLADRLLGSLKAYHASQPLSDGIPREEARVRIFGRAAPAVFEHVLATLVAAQKIVATDRLALAGHRLSLSPEEAGAQSALERVFLEAGLAPPDLATAAAAAGVAPGVADRVSKLLLRQKTLVKVDTLLFHTGPLSTLKDDVRALKGTATPHVDVAGFKERYGITRKYAIPLLEYLDRERVTRRVGDRRVVL
jgi:selenocysteine-specific elongation factor